MQLGKANVKQSTLSPQKYEKLKFPQKKSLLEHSSLYRNRIVKLLRIKAHKGLYILIEPIANQIYPRLLTQ